MEARELISVENLTIEQRLAALKSGSQAINDRMNLRAEQRKDALVNCALNEHNSRFNTKFRIDNIELADFEVLELQKGLAQPETKQLPEVAEPKEEKETNWLRK